MNRNDIFNLRLISQQPVPAQAQAMLLRNRFQPLGSFIIIPWYVSEEKLPVLPGQQIHLKTGNCAYFFIIGV